MMRNFLITLIILFIISCSTSTFVEGPSSIVSVLDNEYMKQEQIDSMLVSDTLPTIGMWMDLTLRDYETKNIISKKFFVKRGSVYIALVKKDSIFITKRIEK